MLDNFLKALGLVRLSALVEEKQNSFQKGKKKAEEKTSKKYEEKISRIQEEHSDEIDLIRKRAKVIFEKRYKEGYDEGQKVITVRKINDDRKPQIVDDGYVVPKELFQITDEHIGAARKNLPLITGRDPSDEQWEVILNPQRSARVVAGAGSGKSTTLLARMWFMHTQLGIPLEEITVFSFTRASVNGFIDDVKKLFDNAGIKKSRKFWEGRVRTFHSKVREFAKILHLGLDARMFDELDRKAADEEDEVNIDDALIYRTNLPDEQVEVLGEAYKLCYANDSDFRKVIDELYIMFLCKVEGDLEAYRQGRELLDKAVLRDALLSEISQNYFDLEAVGLSETGGELELDGELEGVFLHYHTYIPELNIYIVLTPYKVSEEDKEIFSSEFGFGLKGAITVKKQILYTHAKSKNLKFITSQEHLQLYMKLVEENREIQKDSNTPVPPSFSHQLAGDIYSYSIEAAFFHAASFIESLGLDCEDIEEYLTRYHLEKKDSIFLRALLLFWPVFEDVLKSKKIFRYSQFFKYYSDTNLENFEHASSTLMNSLTHIIIDEFQDISPEMVGWIRGILTWQRKRIGVKSSITVVGDDAQSIYGWRGSAPKFLLDFETFFPSAQTARLNMRRNYRSYESIVRCGEGALIYAQDTGEKNAICKPDLDDQHVTILTLDEDSEDIERNMAEEVQRIVNENLPLYMKQLKEKKKPDPYLRIICRTRNDIKKAKKILNRYLEESKFPGVKYSTFHGSKGLEAENCIMMGDPVYSGKNDFKNLVYFVAGFDLSYDQSQIYETKRVAYVALTRAKTRLWWYVLPKDGGAYYDIVKSNWKDKITAPAEVDDGYSDFVL